MKTITNTWLLYKKNACIDKLHDLVNKYKNTYHSAIQMEPFDVKPGTYIDLNKKK